MGIAIFCAAWMYHRRRVANLKMEIAQVQYIAEPVTPPGNGHENILRNLKITIRYSIDDKSCQQNNSYSHSKLINSL